MDIDSQSADTCEFYHSMEIPGLGEVQGQWDLRGHVQEYLGGFDLSGRRVLDVGTASGFLCFEMERMGADVVAFDLSPEHDWDVVPFGGSPDPETRQAMKEHIGRLNRGWHLACERLGSSSRLVHGSVYDMPADQIGLVDIAVYGDILLHLRDPFRALEEGARLAAQGIIVTDTLPPFRRGSGGLLPRFLGRLYHHRASRNLPTMTFIPDPPDSSNRLTWWYLTPSAVAAFLRVLGFKKTAVSYHDQFYVTEDRTIPHFTVVASR